MLCNSETWYNLTQAEFDMLETIDNKLKLLGAPKSNPKESLLLKLGCIPFRHLTQIRQLNYLKTIPMEEKHNCYTHFLKIRKNPKKMIG